MDTFVFQFIWLTLLIIEQVQCQNFGGFGQTSPPLNPFLENNPWQIQGFGFQPRGFPNVLNGFQQQVPFWSQNRVFPGVRDRSQGMFPPVPWRPFNFFPGVRGNQPPWDPGMLNFRENQFPVFPRNQNTITLPPVVINDPQNLNSGLNPGGMAGNEQLDAVGTNAQSGQMQRILPASLANNIQNLARFSTNQLGQSTPFNVSPNQGQGQGQPNREEQSGPVAVFTGNAIDLSRMPNFADRFGMAWGGELIRQLSPQPDSENQGTNTGEFQQAGNQAGPNGNQLAGMGTTSFGDQSANTNPDMGNFPFLGLGNNPSSNFPTFQGFGNNPPFQTFDGNINRPGFDITPNNNQFAGPSVGTGSNNNPFQTLNQFPGSLNPGFSFPQVRGQGGNQLSMPFPTATFPSPSFGGQGGPMNVNNNNNPFTNQLPTGTPNNQLDSSATTNNNNVPNFGTGFTGFPGQMTGQTGINNIPGPFPGFIGPPQFMLGNIGQQGTGTPNTQGTLTGNPAQQTPNVQLPSLTWGQNAQGNQWNFGRSQQSNPFGSNLPNSNPNVGAAETTNTSPGGSATPGQFGTGGTLRTDQNQGNNLSSVSEMITTITDAEGRVLWQRDHPVSREEIMQAVRQLAQNNPIASPPAQGPSTSEFQGASQTQVPAGQGAMGSGGSFSNTNMLFQSPPSSNQVPMSTPVFNFMDQARRAASVSSSRTPSGVFQQFLSRGLSDSGFGQQRSPVMARQFGV